MREARKQRIAEIRKSQGLTQREVALRAGIAQQQLASYEYGKAVPNVITAERIARALGVAIEQIDFSKRPEAA